MKNFLYVLVFAVSLTIAPSTAAAPQPTNAQEPKPDPRSDKLKAFFQKHKCPDVNYQLIPQYLESADRYNIEYTFLPAISIQESSCFRHYPVNTRNGWGWASARTGFTSLQSGIDFISRQLSEGRYYAHKTTEQKLRAYNPNPAYAPAVERLMKEIENE